MSKNHDNFPEFPVFLDKVAPLDTFTGRQRKLDSKILRREDEIRKYTNIIANLDEKLDKPNISTAQQNKLMEMKVKNENKLSESMPYLSERERTVKSKASTKKKL
jgi:hypothetical protein